MRSARRAARIFSAALLLVVTSSQAEDRVHPGPDAVKPLPPGASVPSVRVESATGDAVDLAGLVRDRGALLVFYRGGW